MIKIEEKRMRDTAAKMNALKERNIKLREKLSKLFDDIHGSLKCESGKEIEFVGKTDLLKPLENMDKVLEHMSDTLSILIGDKKNSENSSTEYYDKVFNDYNALILSIKNMNQKTEE